MYLFVFQIFIQKTCSELPPIHREILSKIQTYFNIVPNLVQPKLLDKDGYQIEIVLN